MNKEEITTIFKNRYFQFSIFCYLLIQMLIVPGKYFNIHAENNDFLGASNYIITILTICFIILGLNAILELTYLPNLPDVKLVGMIGRLFVYTLVNWFSFIIYCYILLVITGSLRDFNQVEQSRTNTSILLMGTALYIIIYLAGAAIIIGLRSMGNYFPNVKTLLLNKKSYMYFSIFLIFPTLIGLSGLVENAFFRLLVDLLLTIAIFATYFNFIFLIKHCQRIKLSA
ncbi:hypothetical protein [Leptospira selangorensis]|uniref:hypothetical protein n=1 Tax=Leptospira selangorensis TaxID=2484982 RepID=UPI00142E2A26|nr:hypothetical protein [Leptospira selangorensis]